MDERCELDRLELDPVTFLSAPDIFLPMFRDVVSGVLGIIIWSSFDRVELLLIHIIPWYCP